MRLLDLKADMNLRRVRIFLAKRGIDLPRVEIDMQAGENQMSPQAAFVIGRPQSDAV